MSAISTYLQKILNAIWARDVRQAIHDAISQCYDDSSATTNIVNSMATATAADIGKSLRAKAVSGGKVTKWEFGESNPQAIEQAVTDWLDEHPEATTTVQDGAITESKIADNAVTIEKIDENASILINGYGIKKDISALQNWAQDSSVYNGKIFGVGTVTGVLKIYDIPSGEVLATSRLSGNIKPHGNAVSFGNKQNSDDTYPLLYVAGYNGLDGDGNELPRGSCFVYKINDDYSTELVQSIYVDFVNTSLWLGAEAPSGVVRWGNYIVDADNNFLYVFTSLNENYVSKTRLFKFNIPSLNNNTVRLLESDIVEYHDLPFYPFLQGAEYYDNKLYISCGMSTSDGALAIVDLNNYTQIGYITLGDIMTEPEAVIQVGGDIYVGNRSFYKLSSIPIDTNVGDLAELKTFNNKTIVDAINSMSELYDFSQLVTNKTDLYNGKFIRKGNIATIIYQGQSAAHEHEQVLFTLPVGYRPNYFEYIPAVKDGAAMIVRIDGSTGEGKIWVKPSTLSTNARIYFSHSYICDQ